VPAFVFTLGPTQSSVSEIRTTDDGLDETIEQARRLVAENGHTRSTWTVGPSCRPIGLATNLRARGFVPAMPPLEHSLTAMALVKPPPAPPDGVAAKLVTDFDEYVAAHRISLAGFAVSDDVAAQQLAALPDMWKRYDGVNRFAHLVFVDGRPIGSSFTLAGTIGLVLNGSSVLPEARGRGAYRALVAARWARAVELEKPALVVQAGSMSRADPGKVRLPADLRARPPRRLGGGARRRGVTRDHLWQPGRGALQRQDREDAQTPSDGSRAARVASRCSTLSSSTASWPARR
jgi:GNAT superfamily N-acetyltransferase